MDREQIVKRIAGVAHEANRQYCAAFTGEQHRQWEHAPDWQRQSAMDGVRALLDNPQATPQQSHENWMAHKEADGWAYGEVKDPDAKTHPCLVPYEKLPEEQRVKDAIFTSVVRSLAPLATESPSTSAAKPKPKPRPKSRQKASDPIEPTEDEVNDDG